MEVDPKDIIIGSQGGTNGRVRLGFGFRGGKLKLFTVFKIVQTFDYEIVSQRPCFITALTDFMYCLHVPFNVSRKR